MKQLKHDCSCGHCSCGEGERQTGYWAPLCSLGLLVVGLWMQWNEAGVFRSGTLRLAWFVLAYLPVALPVMKEAWEAILRKEFFSEFLLMSLASLGAFIIGEYPEGVAVMLFYTVGEFFQGRAVNKARSHIQALLDVRPETATVLREGKTVVLPPDKVRVGEIIEVKVGERVPLDGVLTGSGTGFNTAALTGESVPRQIEKDDEVLAGMIPAEKVVRIEVRRPYAESTLSRILDMVEHAGSRKAPAELFIRKFARIYTPIVIVSALLMVVLPYIGSLLVPSLAYDFHDWLYRALVFLVISCPCALVVSIPLSYFGGIGAASRKGILFKGGNYLDEITRVNKVFFDKTGTLTKGVFKVSRVLPADGVSAGQLLSWLAALECGSTHPVARAVCEAAEVEGVKPMPVGQIEEWAGLGVKARSEKGDAVAGKVKLLKDMKIMFPEELEQIPETLVAMALNGCYMGAVVLSDEPKEDAQYAVRQLKKMGVGDLCILSGDKESLVRKLAAYLDIPHAYGDLLPQDKVKYVEEAQQAGEVAAFVGDGLNDAPVLAASRVSMAMGGLGSDAAIETADIVIQNDRPSSIAEAIQIGRRTRRIVWQNIVGAIGVKVLMLLLGAWGIATLWEAVFADVGVALLAVLNAIRLLRFKDFKE